MLYHLQYINVTTMYMKSVLLLLGADDTTDLDTAINEIFQFETDLAEVQHIHMHIHIHTQSGNMEAYNVIITTAYWFKI